MLRSLHGHQLHQNRNELNKQINLWTRQFSKKELVNLFYNALYDDIFEDTDLKYIYYLIDIYKKNKYLTNGKLKEFDISKFGSNYVLLNLGKSSLLLYNFFLVKISYLLLCPYFIIGITI